MTVIVSIAFAAALKVIDVLTSGKKLAGVQSQPIAATNEMGAAIDFNNADSIQAGLEHYKFLDD